MPGPHWPKYPSSHDPNPTNSPGRFSAVEPISFQQLTHWKRALKHDPQVAGRRRYLSVYMVTHNDSTDRGWPALYFRLNRIEATRRWNKRLFSDRKSTR